MTTILWIFLSLQIAMGAFDTIWHHEFTERLAWRTSQKTELKLHGVRNLIYAVLFFMIGWFQPQGIFAMGLGVLLVIEIVITLVDFVEEDRTRKLPASERVTHTLLALNYGLILALLVPTISLWMQAPTGFAPANSGFWAYIMTAAALGVGLFGIRDLLAATRLDRLPHPSAASLATGLTLQGDVLITGATGFIGTRLVEALVANGQSVTVLTRKTANATHLATPIRTITSLSQISDTAQIAAIINLAGEPLAGFLWTRAHKEKVTQSRLKMAEDLVALIDRLKTKPDVMIQGSAIGIYGIQADEPIGEADAIVKDDSFGQALCVAWEAAAQPVVDMGVRLVTLRTGLVLDREGGPLGQMLFPFEFGAGGPFGSGRHWMSWISRDDLVALIAHCVTNADMRGPVNGVAPHPVQNVVFAQGLGRALQRPAILPVPAIILTTLLGGLGKEVLLGSQNIRPDIALAHGFTFQHAYLADALSATLGVLPNSRRVQHDGGLAPVTFEKLG